MATLVPGVVTVSPPDRGGGWETFCSFVTVTVRLPWATATVDMVTFSPITTVPVFSLTTTLARVSGTTVRVSISAMNSATSCCCISLGILSFKALESTVSAIPGPREAFMVSAMRLAVVKSGLNRERVSELLPSSFMGISRSTVAPLAMRATWR